MPDETTPLAANNPYAAPRAESMAALAGTDPDDPKADVRAFVGRNADYYLRKWYWLHKGDSDGQGFNWAAFLLCGFWLAYRKMYRVTLILFGAVLLESIVESVVQRLTETPTPRIVDLAVNLTACMACGFYGNRWYYRHAMRSIAATRAEGLTGPGLRQRLAQRGGTNVIVSLAMVFALVILSFVMLAAFNALLWPGAEVEDFLMP